MILDDKQFYLWVGNDIHPTNRDRFVIYGREYIKLLQSHEGAPSTVIETSQYEEDENFWEIFQVDFLTDYRYGTNVIWNKWYMPIEDSLRSARSNQNKLAYAETDELEARPALFTYPNYIESQRVFFYDDLDDEEMYILCVKDTDKAYIWKGMGFIDECEQDIDEFLKQSVQQIFGNINTEDIEIINETPGEESDEFTSHFN